MLVLITAHFQLSWFQLRLLKQKPGQLEVVMHGLDGFQITVIKYLSRVSDLHVSLSIFLHKKLVKERASGIKLRHYAFA